MNNMPKNAGETKTQYLERVRASKPTGTTPVGPRTQSASVPVKGVIKPGGVGVAGGRPRMGSDTGAPKPRTGAGAGGGVKGGLKNGGVKVGRAPIDSGRGPLPKPPTPVKPVVTTPRPIRSGINDGLGNGNRPRGGVKGGAGTGGGRGTAPRPGYGGGKPKRPMK